MRALVFANGEPPSASLSLELARTAEIIVAADGGADHLLALGLVPDVVVGDLDSVSAAALAALPASALARAGDPSTTDLEKAVTWAAERGATAIDVVGGGGGRIDHTLANLSVLFSHPGVEIRLIDDRFSVRAVRGRAAIDLPLGSVVSLIAIGHCSGVTTWGLRWALAGAELSFSPRGVHNEVVEHPSGVSVRSGDLLLCEGRWVEKHE